MSSTFSFPRAIVRSTSETGSRYSIDGILVRPDGWAVATNGRVLTMVHDDAASSNGMERPVVIPRAAVVGDTGELDVAIDDTTARVSGRDRSRRRRPVVEAEARSDHAFPPYRDVIPEGRPAYAIAVDPALLADACAALVTEDEPGVTLLFDQPNRPIRVVGAKGVAVVMPRTMPGGPTSSVERATMDAEDHWQERLGTAKANA